MERQCQCPMCLQGLSLSEGKFYLNRLGGVVGPMSRRESENPKYPWCRTNSCIRDEVQIRYTNEGKSNIDPVEDLVIERERK
jgi:hypothetical protein